MRPQQVKPYDSIMKAEIHVWSQMAYCNVCVVSLCDFVDAEVEPDPCALSILTPFTIELTG